MNDM